MKKFSYKIPFTLVMFLQSLVIAGFFVFVSQREAQPPQGEVNQVIGNHYTPSDYVSPQKPQGYRGELSFPENTSNQEDWLTGELYKNASLFLMDKGAVGDALALLESHNSLAAYSDEIKSLLFARGRRFLADSLEQEWPQLQNEWQQISRTQMRLLIRNEDMPALSKLLKSPAKGSDLLSLQQSLPEPLALALTHNCLVRFRAAALKPTDREVFLALLPLLNMGHERISTLFKTAEEPSPVLYNEIRQHYQGIIGHDMAVAFEDFSQKLSEEYDYLTEKQKVTYASIFPNRESFTIDKSHGLERCLALRYLASLRLEISGQPLSPYVFFYHDTSDISQFSRSQLTFLLQGSDDYRQAIENFDYRQASSVMVNVCDLHILTSLIGDSKLMALKRHLKKQLLTEERVLQNLLPWDELKRLLGRSDRKPYGFLPKENNDWQKIDSQTFFLALKQLSGSTDSLHKNAALNSMDIYLKNRLWLMDLKLVRPEEATLMLKKKLADL